MLKQEVSLKKIIVEGYRAVGSLNDSFSLNIFYSTISYIYTHAIYIINRIRTEASAYLVLFLLMDTVSQIMAAKTVCYCC